MKPTISAIILAKNEQERIAKCLDSLSWVDEIIVVDNGSFDKTVEIVKKYKAKILTDRTNNFSKLRNAGKTVASGDWLLYVDADEIVSEELQKEIQKAISYLSRKDSGQELSPSERLGTRAISGYKIRRKNYYLSHPWPTDEYILRLMRKAALVEWKGELHETAHVQGDIGQLAAPIIHKTHRTLEEMVRKTNEWSAVEAKLRFDTGHPPVVWWRLFRVMLTGFWNSFIRQEGWKAGTVGWIESMYQAFSMFITYAKLWELQQKIHKK